MTPRAGSGPAASTIIVPAGTARRGAPATQPETPGRAPGSAASVPPLAALPPEARTADDAAAVGVTVPAQAAGRTAERAAP